jgi:hypothetical protein
VSPLPTGPAPSFLLNAALGGRARDVQARLVEKLPRQDVRELADAIDELVMHEIGVYASRVDSFGNRERERLAGVRMSRRGVVSHG